MKQVKNWFRENGNAILQRLATNMVWAIIAAVGSAIVWVFVAIYQNWSFAGIILGLAVVIPAALWSVTWLFELFSSIASHDVVRQTLLGTWHVSKGSYRADWTFFEDGMVSSTSGAPRGKWKLETDKVRVLIDWGGHEHAWESFRFSLNPYRTIGESWTKETLEAVKHGHTPESSATLGNQSNQAPGLRLVEKHRSVNNCKDMVQELIAAAPPLSPMNRQDVAKWGKKCVSTLKEILSDDHEDEWMKIYAKLWRAEDSRISPESQLVEWVEEIGIQLRAIHARFNHTMVRRTPRMSSGEYDLLYPSPVGCIRCDGIELKFSGGDDAVTVCVKLFNVTDQLISVNGMCVQAKLEDESPPHSLPQGKPFFIARQSAATFIGVVVKNAGWQAVSVFRMQVDYELSYDSVPPVRPRVSKKSHSLTAYIAPEDRRDGAASIECVVLDESET